MFEKLVIPCFWQIKGHRNLCAGCLDKVYMTDQNMFDIVKLDCKYLSRQIKYQILVVH